MSYEFGRNLQERNLKFPWLGMEEKWVNSVNWSRVKGEPQKPLVSLTLAPFSRRLEW